MQQNQINQNQDEQYLTNQLQPYEEYEEYTEDYEELEELNEQELNELAPNEAVIYTLAQIQRNQAPANQILTVQEQINNLKINEVKKIYPGIMRLSSEKIVVVLYAFAKYIHIFQFSTQKQIYQLIEHLLETKLTEQNEIYLQVIMLEFLQQKFHVYNQKNTEKLNIQFYKRFIKNLIQKNQLTDQNCRILKNVFINLPKDYQVQIVQYFIKQLAFFISMNQKGKAIGLFTTKTKSQKKANKSSVENKLLSQQTFNFCKITWILTSQLDNYAFPLTDLCLEICLMLELNPNAYCFILQLCNQIIENQKNFVPLFQFFLRILSFIFQPLSNSSLQINLKIYSNKLFEQDGQSIKKNLVIVPIQFTKTLLYKTYLFQMWNEILRKYLKQILRIKQQVFPEATNAFLYQLNIFIDDFYKNKMKFKEFQKGSEKQILNELKEIKRIITDQQAQIKYQRGKQGKYQDLDEKTLILFNEVQKQETEVKKQKIEEKPIKSEENEDQDVIKPLIL